MANQIDALATDVARAEKAWQRAVDKKAQAEADLAAAEQALATAQAAYKAHVATFLRDARAAVGVP